MKDSTKISILSRSWMPCWPQTLRAASNIPPMWPMVTLPACHLSENFASACMQGVICFESIMRAAESKGFVHEGTPIICKPSFKV